MSADRFPVVTRLPVTVDAPRLARQVAVEAFSRRALSSERAEDLALVISELVTNAVMHGPPGGEIELRLTATEFSIRVEVIDAGTERFEWPAVAGDRRHGLDLVAMFSERAGLLHEPSTTAWCELDLVTG